MADIWFISDTHFFHDNIIRFCARPFSNSTEMNEKMIENWNKMVRPQDKVYHLGDVAMGCTDKELAILLQRLNGHKRLIVGNHDTIKSPAIQNNFEKINLWAGQHDWGFTAMHVPNSIEQLPWGKYQVHGHIHNAEHSDPHYINVCVEQIGYTPIHLETIKQIINARDKDISK
jgi:calcineurin-like phosphoesterase family protein